MTGLLLKDIYTVLKQMKFFVLVVIIMACLPGYSMLTFALVYSAMLPMTALAYDERSGWDKLAGTMPYSTMDIVLSKYALGYIMIAGATLISALAQGILAAVGVAKPVENVLMQIAGAVGIALFFEAVVLPLMIRFGVEKGRVIFIAIGAAIGVLIATAYKSIDSFQLPDGLNTTTLTVGVVLVLLVLNAISMLISVKSYEFKKG